MRRIHYKLLILIILSICLITYLFIEKNTHIKSKQFLKSIDFEKINYIDIKFQETTIRCSDKKSLKEFELLLTNLLVLDNDNSMIRREQREYYIVSFIVDSSFFVLDFGFPENNDYIYLYSKINNTSITFGYQLPKTEIVGYKDFFKDFFLPTNIDFSNKEE